MRLLIIGSNNENSIERYYLKYLPEIIISNSQIDFFAAHDIFLNYYYSNIINKILYRIGISNILFRINRIIKQKVNEFKPDVILVFKGMEIFPSTLRWIKKKSILTVNYNPDNPFIFSGRGSGNKHLKNSLPFYDLFITYDNRIASSVKSKLGIECAVIPFGFDQVLEFAESQEEILKLCFVGNEDKERLSFLNELSKRGIEIDLYGDWNKKFLHSNINYLGKLNNDELLSRMSKYRIQLNLLRIHNSGSHNMRTFEIPASGSIQLAPLTSDHLTFFVPDKEIFLFSDVDDCILKISRLLSVEKGITDQFKKLSQKKIMNSGYSYYHRSISLMNAINKVNSKCQEV